MSSPLEKIPVLIVCDAGSDLKRTVLDALSILPDVELVFAVDLHGVELQLQDHAFAFVVLDKTVKGEGAVFAECIRRSAQGKTLPLLFTIEEKEDADHLYSLFGSGFVDCLPLPISVKILKNRGQLLVELHRLKRQVEIQAADYDAKILELEVLHQELDEKSHRLELLSSLDTLTGLFNRYYFDDNLQKEWRQAVRENVPLSLLFIDVDYLKAFNGYYGHEEGDDCLREMAGILYQTLLRPVDIIARYGGDQFAVILPGTDVAGARLVAKRMMENVASLNRVNAVSPVSDCVTISVGGATTRPSTSEKARNFIDKAEKALAEAKAAGRNRICHL